MSKQTKMDGSDSPLMEFNIPESEIDAPVEIGDIGTIVVPVVVVASNDGMVTFRKTNTVSIEGGFRKETLDEMRKRIIDEQDKKEEKAEPKSKE